MIKSLDFILTKINKQYIKIAVHKMVLYMEEIEKKEEIIETVTFGKQCIRFAVQKYESEEVVTRKIEENNIEIDVVIIKESSRWCRILARPPVHDVIKKLGGIIVSKKPPFFWYYSYKPALEFCDSLQKLEY